MQLLTLKELQINPAARDMVRRMAEEIHGLPEREPDQGQDDTASARSGGAAEV
jgi:hypothetical protein